MEDKSVSLTWNDHSSTYKSMFNVLRQKNVLTDITLACDGHKFVAHQLVLVTCSEYFQSILSDISCPHPIMYLRGVAAVEMQALLDFMYTGQVDIPHTHVARLLATAEALRIKGLALIIAPGKLEDGEDILDEVDHHIQEQLAHTQDPPSHTHVQGDQTHKFADHIRKPEEHIIESADQMQNQGNHYIHDNEDHHIHEQGDHLQDQEEEMEEDEEKEEEEFLNNKEGEREEKILLASYDNMESDSKIVNQDVIHDVAFENSGSQFNSQIELSPKHRKQAVLHLKYSNCSISTPNGSSKSEKIPHTNQMKPLQVTNNYSRHSNSTSNNGVCDNNPLHLNSVSNFITVTSESSTPQTYKHSSSCTDGSDFPGSLGQLFSDTLDRKSGKVLNYTLAELERNKSSFAGLEQDSSFAVLHEEQHPGVSVKSEFPCGAGGGGSSSSGGGKAEADPTVGLEGALLVGGEDDGFDNAGGGGGGNSFGGGSNSFEEDAQYYLEAFTRSAGLSKTVTTQQQEQPQLQQNLQQNPAGGCVTLDPSFCSTGTSGSSSNLTPILDTSVVAPVTGGGGNENRPYACPICKKSFGKAAILKRHHMAHFRPYSCQLCPRSFTRREVLAEHMQEHNGKDMRLPCPVCTMTIKRKRNLQAHIKVKHPEYYHHRLANKQALC